MTEPKSTGYGSALNKALTVLEQVTAQPQAIGLADLSERLDMPKQTLHRALVSLEEHGLVVRDTVRDRFYVGPRLTQLAIASLFSENHNLPTRAILQQLVDEIGESCNIGVLNGMEFVYLDRIQTEHSLRIHFDLGNRVPAYCTSGGKVLLAYLPDDQRGALMRSLRLKKYTGNTVTNPAQIETDLKRFRRLGYSTNDEEFTPGVVGIAAPILDGGGRAIAAVACHAPSARTSLRALRKNIPLLERTAKALGAYWS